MTILLLLAVLDGLGKICPDPRDAKCAGWTPHDIGFMVPKDGVARDEFRSEPFYAVMNLKVGFIAVYGGATLAEARQFLKAVTATGKSPGANVRKMQAILVYP